jgi:lambda repressor-like predicted transcriptional regulator
VVATTDEEVREEIRAAMKVAGSLRKWAKANDLQPSYVSDVVNGVKPPGESILRAIGRRRRTIYEKAEGSEA